MPLANIINQFNKVSLYLTLVNFSAILLIIFTFNGYQPENLNKWILLYSMAGSIIILSYWTIMLLPTGHSFSMDSSLYIASLFLLGFDFSILLLIVVSLGDALFRYKKGVVKHLTNFSIYALSLIIAHHLFIMQGGDPGSINRAEILPYIATLVGFAVVNVLLIALYYSLYSKTPLKSIVKKMGKESVSTYFIILLLSLILSMVIDTYQLFGLFLYTVLAALLGVVFKNYYKIYEEVSTKAIIDNRTGLFNHGYFEDHLEKMLVEAKGKQGVFSLVLIDIDDFKKYNDTFGHYKGDQLIEFIAKHLKYSFKETNGIVARYGGEEFTVLLPGMNKMDAFDLVNRTRKELNDSYFNGCEVLPYGCISFSAGIAEYQKEIYDKAHLIENADQAMYAAKKRAKNEVQTFPFKEDPAGMYEIEDGMKYLEESLTLFKAKDIYTFQHSKRVFKYTVEFAAKLNLDQKSTELLRYGALIHDIGKIEIPRHILTKKGKLTPEEWATIKMHVTWGKEIIELNKQLKDLIPLVELHHERFDGRGYPHGLKGEEIPLLARLLCIVDSFDAMTTERPYQKTKTFDEAFIELRNCSGQQFDPNCVEPFIEMIQEIYMHDQHQPTSPKEKSQEVLIY
jgi:diguanylate cyclase (GGDEF)-like protein/putative nucleotidyltransferase with HDIG domain